MRPIRAMRMSRRPGPQGAGVSQAAGPGHRGAAVEHPAHTVDRPGNLGGSDPWEDAGSWRHSGNTRRSCANAR